MKKIALTLKSESYFKRMFRASLRSYFAPLTAALRAVRDEMNRDDVSKKRPEN